MGLAFDINEMTQFADALVSAASAFVIIAGAGGHILKIIAAAKKPEIAQNERMDGFEKELQSIKEKLTDHDDYLSNDEHHIELIETGNRVTQEALLALLSHAVSGNGIEELKNAESNLKYYLIHNKEKGGKTNE